jgi:hypothetical protein
VKELLAAMMTAEGKKMLLLLTTGRKNKNTNAVPVERRTKTHKDTTDNFL